MGARSTRVELRSLRSVFICLGLLLLAMTVRLVLSTSTKLPIEEANRLVWCRFGKNITFSDERLHVINFTAVPLSCSNAHFIVLVSSKRNATTKRTQLRNTYGRMQKEFNFRMFFVLGMSRTKENDDSIKEEAEVHGDILQIDTIDSYKNLTIKNIAAMRYVAGVCTNVGAVLKIGGDVAWDVTNASSLIDSSITKGSIYCPQAEKPPVRDVKTPRYASGKKFGDMDDSPHCYGFAYVIPLTALFSILDAAKTEHLIRMEDEFITGQLAWKSGVKHVNITNRVSFYRDNENWFPGAVFSLVGDSQAMEFFVLSNAKWFLQRFLN